MVDSLRNFGIIIAKNYQPHIPNLAPSQFSPQVQTITDISIHTIILFASFACLNDKLKYKIFCK
jgi:hypothetical protein